MLGKDKRYQTAGAMLESIKKLVTLAENDGVILIVLFPSLASFVGWAHMGGKFLGEHKDDHLQLSWYGLKIGGDSRVVVSPRVLIGTCERCGNIQQFRLDYLNKLSSFWRNRPQSPYA